MKMGDKYFLTAMYLRLSRDDNDVGRSKTESDSIGNQRALIRSYISENPDMELYDIYADDGYSGSNFDRPEFKRMIGDIEAGAVNCVIVKDLSRFGRDYIESGRFIQKIFPALGVRFIALTDHYDSFNADTGESGIVLPVKNFINDSYCRDISTKVKSQFAVKRKNGECIAPFAVYGYRKAESNKNRLVVDEYAAGIVRKIFAWKTEGNAILAIADKLNRSGVLAPKEYKKSMGENYKGGFGGPDVSLWSSATVKRILTNEIYLGHMVQGKTEKINYKLKKSIKKPEKDWIKVKNTHEPIVSEEDFLIVRNLLKTDGRISPVSGETGFFTGILFCGDCKEQMIRRLNRYKNSQKLYYICSTKNRGEGCTRHGIQEETLKELVTETVRKFTDCFMDEELILRETPKTKNNRVQIDFYNTEIEKLEKEKDKYITLCSGLDDDLKEGIITEEEYDRLKFRFNRKAEEYEEIKNRQKETVKKLLKTGDLSAGEPEKMTKDLKSKGIDRYFLCLMVKEIRIFEGRRIEMELYFTDGFRRQGVD